jgi:hypothetical protein
MHWGLYIHSLFPQAHVRGGALTAAGEVHLLYMAIGLSIIFLFYLCTMDVTGKAVSLVSILLLVHVIVGTLVPLKVWASFVQPAWYPEELSFDTATMATIAAVAVMLFIGFLWATRSS